MTIYRELVRCTSAQHAYYNKHIIIHYIRCYTLRVKTTTVNVFEVTIVVYLLGTYYCYIEFHVAAN